jgi:hypothetical protein
VLIQQLQQRGESPVPAQIEAIYTRVLHDREIRQNISAMRAAGATVLYYQVDVRDEKAFSGLIADIYESYGRLDAVIHGAGLIEDKLLEDKLPDSFDRVLHTKIDSALILSRKLRPESLKLLTFFSSVAGRFGNRGQSDYAAANEVLNKLALFLDRTWLARVVAINWGPWEKTGMVSSEVERQFIERGVQIIPPAAGCHVFNEEICLGVKGEGEVILGGGPWDTVSASDLPKVDLALPLLKNTVPSSLGRADGIEVFHQLDPSCDIYLQDHRIDGKPVFPMAMAMELMAEVVQQAWPEWHVSGIHALRVLRGIVLENGARTVHVVARPQIQSAAEEELRVHVEILEAEGALPAYYRGTVHLSNRLSATSLATMPTPSDVRPFPMTIEDAYQRWLFHGPCFQRIVTIEDANDNWISAIVQPSLPQHCLRHAAEGRWLIDPIMIDCGFQLAILWARAHHDMTPLPSKLGGYRRFGTPSGAPIRCRMQAETRGGGTLLFNQFFFSETNGRLLGVIEDMESTCSKALNRLGRDVIS